MIIKSVCNERQMKISRNGYFFLRGSANVGFNHENRILLIEEGHKDIDGVLGGFRVSDVEEILSL